MKSKSLPEHVTRLTTYAELHQFAEAFAEQHLNLLLVIGAAGLGKSKCVENAVGKKACKIDGNASAFWVYIEAYHHRNEPIILDDVDRLYSDRNGVRLLKSLCQTDPLKTVAWHTDAAGLDREGVPRKFVTTSRVCIIGNQWRTTNADVVALEDRGHAVVFQPDAFEVHREAARWFWNQDVFTFVGDHLHLIKRPSLRNYLLADELMAARLDWRGGVLSRCLSGTALLVAKLKADPMFNSEKERVNAFIKSGGGCRATYFNHARHLERPHHVPRMLLTNSVPRLGKAPD